MKRSNQPSRRFPYGIILGVAVGIALGVALQNIVIGIAIGAGLAFLFGTALGLSRRKTDSDE